MLFFQAMLLAGYAYVLITIKWLGLRRQAVLHLALLLLALLHCHIRLSENSVVFVSTHTYPTLWLLGKLLTTVGLPVFVISASAPLLQKWFSSTSHPSARDPYFLYAASNAGSSVVLAAFPLLLEPNFRLLKQGLLWAGAYGVLVVLILSCVVGMWRLGSLKSETKLKANQGGEDAKPKETISTLTCVRWMTLAFIPSSLVLGVTTYITTDIASTPLLFTAATTATAPLASAASMKSSPLKRLPRNAPKTLPRTTLRWSMAKPVTAESLSMPGEVAQTHADHFFSRTKGSTSAMLGSRLLVGPNAEHRRDPADRLRHHGRDIPAGVAEAKSLGGRLGFVEHDDDHIARLVHRENTGEVVITRWWNTAADDLVGGAGLAADAIAWRVGLAAGALA